MLYFCSNLLQNKTKYAEVIIDFILRRMSEHYQQNAYCLKWHDGSLDDINTFLQLMLFDDERRG